MITISTKEELEAHRNKIHAETLLKNPDREFEVLFGDNGGGKQGFIIIWLDGKGALND